MSPEWQCLVFVFGIICVLAAIAFSGPTRWRAPSTYLTLAVGSLIVVALANAWVASRFTQ